MVSIEIGRNSHGAMISLSMKGHAGFDEHGYDIVCAALSVLSCTTILGLEQLTEQKGLWENGQGYTLIQLEEPITKESQLLLETMRLGMVEIAKQYASFVTISEE